MYERRTKGNALKWIFIIIFVLSSTAVLVPQADDVISSLIRQLTVRLDLSGEQAAKINSIISSSQAQMTRDREMFGDNEPALIEMAKKRRDMTEMHIRAVLTPGQLEKYQPVKDPLYLDDEVVSLMEKLAMTYPQAYKTAEIMELENKQALLDRETYKRSALALISAARARRELADIRIQDYLNPQQQQKFSAFKQERDTDNEFFELEEGLILDQEQATKVRQILEDFHQSTMETMGTPGDREKQGMQMFRGRSGMHGRSGGMGFGMGGSRGGHGRERGGPGPDNPMLQKMKEQEEQKIKAIMEILLPEQSQRYEQILEKKKQDMAARMNQRMGNWR